LAALLATVACGAAQSGPSTQEQGTESPTAFDDLKPGERVAFMKNVVMPRMSELFRSFDQQRYGEVNCATCHGSGARQGNFHMPSADLPRLDPADRFAAHVAEAPEVTRFMMEQVVPQMAELLGEHAYDPQKGEGFGCFDCHEKK
jgi:hypothetical protein